MSIVRKYDYIFDKLFVLLTICSMYIILTGVVLSTLFCYFFYIIKAILFEFEVKVITIKI